MTAAEVRELLLAGLAALQPADRDQHIKVDKLAWAVNVAPDETFGGLAVAATSPPAPN